MGLAAVTTSYVAFSVLHFVLFVLALTVCGLYGVDLQRAAVADSKWVSGDATTWSLDPASTSLLLLCNKC